MKIVFLYPGLGEYDSLCGWVRSIARHSKHEVVLSATPEVDGDLFFALTQAEVYPHINKDLAILKERGKLFGVVHNEHYPPVPYPPGHYPSFAWTQTAMRKLEAYKPDLVRQPVLPPCGCSWNRSKIHVGTFGAMEPKKWTAQMAMRCHLLDIPFTAFVPEPLAKDPEGAIVRRSYRDVVIRIPGANVITYGWTKRVEDLAPFFTDITHFMFVLPPSKEGTGGSCTSPRCATAFGRPVIVVDDEDTFALDNFTVYDDLRAIKRADFDRMAAPLTDWGADNYLETLCVLTKEFWQ